MNKFRIAYITMTLPHTIKKILKTIREKDRFPSKE